MLEDSLGKKRVYTLAKELGLSSRELVEIIRNMGIEIKSHSSTVTEEEEERIRRFVKGEEKKKKEEVEKVEEKEERKEVREERPVAVTIKEKRRRPKRPQVDRQEVEKKLKETLAKLERGERLPKRRKKKKREVEEEEEENVVKVTEFISVAEFAKLIQVDPTEIIAKCLEIGLPVTINQRLDFDTISMIAEEFGYKAVLHEEYEIEEIEEESEYGEERERPPVVTVMGHVDHGKTSLLDRIRQTNVVATEKGGITQRIGAYHAEYDGKKITFIDTPGHHAFTAMRARGAQVTDIVILVVAADDGVMPQTIEALNHAKAAGVPIIVAINKIDLPQANPMMVKQQLAEHGILVQEFGGDVLCVEVSAKTGQGIDELLEAILLLAEELKLTAPFEGPATGVVLEVKKEKGRGNVVTVLIEKGKLKIGDAFVAGIAHGRVRAMFDEWRRKMNEATPSTAVEILGFDELPEVGDRFVVVEDERKAREIANKRRAVKREQERRRPVFGLELFQEELKKGEVKELKLIVKGDEAGPVEALADAIQDLSTEEVKVNVIHRGVGEVSESDILLASASKAIVVAYHVGAPPQVRELAKREGVEIRTYHIIYDALNDIRSAMAGLLEPIEVEEEIGEVEIRQLFKVPKVGIVFGCYVRQGRIVRGNPVRVYRGEELIKETKVSSLKRFKEDVKEVEEGYECGVGLEDPKGIKEGDIIRVYEIIKKAREL